MGSEALKIGTSVTKDSSEMIENSTGAKKNFHLFKLIRNCPVESLFTQKIKVFPSKVSCLVRKKNL